MIDLKLTLLCLLLVISCPGIAQTVATFVPSGSNVDEALLQTENGDLYGAGYVNGSLNRINGSTVVSVLDSLQSPSEMAELSTGEIATAESQSHRVVLFNPANNSHQLLTDEIQNPAGVLKMPNSDTLLVTSLSNNSIHQVAPNGDTSLYLANVLLSSPASLLWDDSNNLYIANYNSGTIVKHTSGNAVDSFCTLPTSSLGHIVKSGNYIYATGVFSHQIYQVDISTGAWSTFAGSVQGSVDGDLSTARFNTPNGIAVSATGDSLYISEYNTQSIRLISGIGITSGISEADRNYLNPAVTIWPNPVKNSCFIQFDGKNGPFNPEYINAFGSTANIDATFQYSSPNIIQVDFPENTPSGVYFLKISGPAFTKTKKIILCND